MLYSIILACTLDGGIGYNNYIPWNIKNELALFKQITIKTSTDFKYNAIIMGRKTWDSLLYKPLKGRINIVITKDDKFDTGDNIYAFNSLDKAFEFCEVSTKVDKVFVIGGKTIYDACLNNENHFKNIENVYLSVIYKYYNCNVLINLKKILANFTTDIKSIIFDSQFLHLKLIKK
jgi:dihydrofolate reductase